MNELLCLMICLLVEYSENHERVFVFDDLSISRIFGKL